MILLISMNIMASAGIPEIIDGLEPGEWYEIPNSSLEEFNIYPDPVPYGMTGVESVMSAWSSAVYDTKRNELMVWGGGHGPDCV